MFGKRLQELRKEKGLSQKDFAIAIGYSQAQISQWETNVNEPTASAIIKIADYFNVSTDYLLGRNDFD